MTAEKTRPRDDLRPTPRLNARRILQTLGPGLVTGASDDDPSGIATYAQAGAQYSYRSLWTVIGCLPLMIAVQAICDQTALATGKNLGELVRDKYSQRARLLVWALLIALLFANALNIAADLVAVGQGATLMHLGPTPYWSAGAGIVIMLLVGLGTFDVVSFVFRLLCLSLLAYPIVLLMVHVDWGSVRNALVGLDGGGGSDYWKIIVAIFGTTLSPYLFFWQSAHRVEDIDADEAGGVAATLPDEPSKRGVKRRLVQSRLDVITGMVLSEVVMFAIITATAATLGPKHTALQSAADAARSLQPLAGDAAGVLFALGFMCSGILAVPVLAGSAASGLAGLAKRESGFSRRFGQAPLFYVLVALGTIGGTLLSVVYSDPFSLLVLSAVVNGIAAAPFMVIVMLIARDREVMAGYRIGKAISALGWFATLIMAAVGVVGLVTL